MDQYDVIVIGGGAVGCAILRELSRYDLKIALVEKESDVARGTSGKNSGVVHAGFNYTPGSKIAKFCVEGSQGFEALCSELDVPYKKTGKLLVAFDENDEKTLRGLIKRGVENGVKGLRYVDADEVKRLEPHVGGIGGMWSGETAVTNVFLYTIALAENAAANEADIYFNYQVTGIEKKGDTFDVKAADGRELNCRYIVNSAGCCADKIAAMLGDDRFRAYPYKGEYLLLDKKAYEFVKHPVYPAPLPGYLGVHLTPTEDDNILIGPSAEFVEDVDDIGISAKKASELFAEAKKLCPPLQLGHVITSYAGMRSRVAPPGAGVPDFHIEYSFACGQLLNLIGIESPGLTSSMPIARYVVSLLGEKLDMRKKENFKNTRKGIIRFRDLALEEQEKLIEEDPDYGEIVCRCESITKREVLDAINNPLGVINITGIKVRSRATMGRCQGGYCLMRIVKILTDEFGISPEEICYNNKDSHSFVGRVK